MNLYVPHASHRGACKGAAGVRSLTECCVEQCIKNLTLFAFSAENWSRPSDELSTLIGLFVQQLEKWPHSLPQA
jgi:undecaprenyl diphosphate synthase